jgi:hypothetical protein
MKHLPHTRRKLQLPDLFDWVARQDVHPSDYGSANAGHRASFRNRKPFALKI